MSRVRTAVHVKTVSTSIHVNVWLDIQGNIAESVRIFTYTINEYTCPCLAGYTGRNCSVGKYIL